MKVVVNTEDIEFYNIFYKFGKELNHQIINAKVESILFENISKNDVDAYVLANDRPYFKKAIDIIKKSNPYVPVIGIIMQECTFNVPADMYLDYPMDFEGDSARLVLAETILHNVNTYIKAFHTLKKLTTKIEDSIEFGDCSYDPTRRILCYKGKDVKKLSGKEAGIIEILASNYGQIVKKEIIMEKVWRKSDYFTSRSLDVFCSYLRKIFKANNINMRITNVSGIGLILEENDKRN